MTPGDDSGTPLPVEWLEPAVSQPLPGARLVWRPPPRRQPRRSLAIAIALFIATAFSTLARQGAIRRRLCRGPGAVLQSDFFSAYFRRCRKPHLFLAGIPFAATLMGILLAHELGHFFACRYYRICATYPYFVPAPTLIGTLGAFIRIRSSIADRRALFDMAFAGPLVGFVLAVPALAFAVAHSKIVLAAQTDYTLVFGRPVVEMATRSWLRPGVPHANLLLPPMGRGAWVGLFATALNLLPAGQLDGGHILYTLTSRWHRFITIGVAAALVPLAVFFWWGWLIWAALLLAIAFRHPPLVDTWTPLGRRRQMLAGWRAGNLYRCFYALHHS